MAHPSFNKIGDYFRGVIAVAAAAVAAGTGDNTETNGDTIDRNVAGLGLATSAVFNLMCRAVLSAGKKATLKATFQHGAASNGSDMADVAAALQPEGAADSVVLTLTDSGAGSTMKGLYQRDVDLLSLSRYIRAQVHIDLDAGATDTAVYTAMFELGGFQALPA